MFSFFNFWSYIILAMTGSIEAALLVALYRLSRS